MLPANLFGDAGRALPNPASYRRCNRLTRGQVRQNRLSVGWWQAWNYSGRFSGRHALVLASAMWLSIAVVGQHIVENELCRAASYRRHYRESVLPLSRSLRGALDTSVFVYIM